MHAHRTSGRFTRLALAVSVVVVALCLLLAALRLPVTAEASAVLAPPVHITLTATGPDPASISVEVGTTVSWLNATGKGVYLGAVTSRLFLPILLSAGTTASAVVAAAPPSPAADPWISVVLAAGESYTHTFDLPGDFRYMAVGTGYVHVYAVPDFELGVAPREQIVVRGATAHFQVAVTPSWGFSTPVTLGVLDLPAGISAAPAQNPLLPPGNTELVLTVQPTATVGSYPLRVVGIGAGQAHTAPITVALTTDLPNLAWLELEAAPRDGDLLEVTANIHNDGQGWVDRPFGVAWRLDPAWQPGLPSEVSGTLSLPYLAAGTSAEVSVTVPFDRPGSYHLYGVLDPSAAITETNESDNSFAALFSAPGRVEMCGELVGEAVWTGGPYVLTCDVTIPTGSSLDIGAGVVVKPMHGSVRLIVDGELNTHGVPGQPVILTSYYDDAAGGDTDGDGGATPPAPGHWGQVWLRPGSRAGLVETIVRYAGWGNWAAVQHEGAALDLTAGAIITNTQYGIDSRNAGGLSLDGTAVSGHNYGIRMEGTTSGPVTIARGQFNANSIAGVQFDGPLAATEVLSSTFAGNGSALVIGGQASDVLLQGNLITASSGPAVRLEGLAGAGPRFVGNTAVGNARNGVELTGYVNGDGRLTRSDPTLAYYIDRTSFTVESGAWLDIEPGSVLKLWWTPYAAGGQLRALSGSRLTMLGTPGRPITVTSLADDSIGGDTNNDAGASQPGTPSWYNISLEGAVQAELSYTSLRYGGATGGGYGYSEAPMLNAPGPGAAVTLTHVLVEKAINSGAGFNSPASLRITDSTFAENQNHGLYLEGAFGAPPQISASHFVSNTQGERQPAGLFVANPIPGLTVSDSEFRGNNAALVLNNLSGPGPVLVGNSFSRNDRNGIRLQGSASGTSTLRRPEPLVAYYIDRTSFTVESGAWLDIEPGSVLKLWWTPYAAGGQLRALSGSRLTMLGTPGRPITVTSLADDSIGGDTNNDAGASQPGTPSWYNISLEGAVQAELSYTSLRYGGATGGGYGYSEAPMLNAPGPGAAVTLTHVLVEKAVNSGAGFNSPASLRITDSTFAENQNHGLYLEGAFGAPPQISASHFVSNTQGERQPAGLFVANPIPGLTVSDSEFRGNNAALVLNNLSGPGPVLVGNSFSRNDRNGIRLQGSASGTSTLRRPEPLVAYYIDRTSFTVESGAWLDIEPGSVLKLWWTPYAAGGQLRALSGSRLTMLGTPGRPITVTSLADDSIGGDTNNDAGASQPGTPSWYNISLEGAVQAELSYTSLRYGGATGGGYGYSEAPMLNAPGPGAAVTLTHVLVEKAINSGAGFNSPASLRITDSTFAENREGLVVTGPAAPAVVDSAFLNNFANGLRLQAVVTGTIISACDVSGNPTGILTEENARADIVGCSIHGNPTWGLDNSSAAVIIEARGNWWGSATGPYNATGNPAGLGDRVRGNVIFSPWLTGAP